MQRVVLTSHRGRRGGSEGDAGIVLFNMLGAYGGLVEGLRNGRIVELNERLKRRIKIANYRGLAICKRS